MKPGREIARFEHRGMPNDQGRVYQASLRGDGQALFRHYSPTATVINHWRRVRGWKERFGTLEAAKADYVKRGYVELPMTPSAQNYVTISH
jgi:hypothetical protein